MLMRNECVACVLNQIIRAGKYMDLDEKRAGNVFQEALKRSFETDYSKLTPPIFSEKIYKALSELTGNNDPYKKLRKEQNDHILNNIKFFRERIESSEDPLFTSLFYSLLGNIIDYGGVEIFSTEQIFQATGDVKLTINDYGKLTIELENAESFLIISDNAGEAVFDMLFIEQLKLKYPGISVRYCVKSGPAINDILREDAEYIGIGEIAEIIETGSTYAGTMLDSSDPEFVDLFYSSDIVISKGQGNFETLEMEAGRDIFFIFKVKCDIVAGQTGLEKGSLVLGYRNSIPG